jgi:hypothetical protein
MKIEDYLFEVEINPESEYHIYAIADPETFDVKYVGQTINTRTRFKAHISEAKNSEGNHISSNKKFRQWLRVLLQNEQLPKFFILEIVKGQDLANKRETYWIRRYNDTSLLNRKTRIR